MKRKLSAIMILFQVIVVFTGLASENDLPLNERIKILTITPYGEVTRAIFEDTLQDITYEAIKESVLRKIRAGYKPDCECDFDNAFFLNLANRPIPYGGERDNPPVIRFPGTFKEGGDKLIDIRIQCKIILSQNKKYAGLVFQQHINTGLKHQHFLLVNSKGDILWEMPHEMKETLADNLLRRIDFPNDSENRIDGHYRVSNEGKVVYSKSHMYDREKFWELYHKDGKLIKKQSNWCALVEFSPDGSYFLVQENNEPQPSQFDPESGVSCYDANSGELLWRNKNILPIQDAGYFISPSGNKILACRKGFFYDLCLLNKNGKILSTATGFEKERYSADSASMFWSPCETLLIIRKTLLGDDLKYFKNRRNVHSFPDITSGLKSNNAGLFITDVIPLTEQNLVAVGFQKPDSLEKPIENYKRYRFIALLDYQMEIQGVTLFQTAFSEDSTNRLSVDSRSGTLFWNTNHFSLQAEFNLFGDSE